ncbi:MAG: YdeI/OmpD-associated family protein, partial [Lysobacterales bacterium]
LKKRIDEETYARRFTPRNARSLWSPQNTGLAKQLIELGLMTRAGFEAFNQRVTDGEEQLKEQEIVLSDDIENALKANKKAWENFTQLTPGYRKQYVTWLQSAKRPEPRKKQLEEAINRLENNQKPGMK